MLYSDAGNYKLHVVANNALPNQRGTPKRVALTVNHIEYYDFTPYAERELKPTEERIKRLNDWKITGDKRTWRVSHVQELLKPATRVDRASVTSYLVILEQVIINPEKDLAEAKVAGNKSVCFLRKFDNLITDEEV
jgi:hypothetical protein